MEVHRQARRDLGGLPPERVREVLELARAPIASEIGRLRYALRRCASIDEDDLRALGQIAALEAAQTHDPERGSTLRSWISFLVRQRLAEAMKDAGDLASTEVPLGLIGDYEAFMGAYDPIEAYELASAREWVKRSLARLTPRQKILIVHLLGNTCETYRELGATLGVDHTRVFQDVQVAISTLSVRAHRPVRARILELVQFEVREVRPAMQEEQRQCA